MGNRLTIDQKELISGAIFLGIGAAFLIGTIPLLDAHNLGVFPGACAVLLSIVGIIKMIKGLLSKQAVKVEMGGLKEYLLILGSIMVFGILAETLGVILATAVSVIVSSLNTFRQRWKEILLIAFGSAAFVYIVFVCIFSVNVPVWPWG